MLTHIFFQDVMQFSSCRVQKHYSNCYKSQVMDTYLSILRVIWRLKISPTAWHCVVKSWCMPLISHLNYTSNFTHIMSALLYVLVPSAPQRLRVLTKTTSQIKITWEAPAISNGVLRGYQVDVRGKKGCLHFNDVWGFLFLN